MHIAIFQLKKYATFIKKLSVILCCVSLTSYFSISLANNSFNLPDLGSTANNRLSTDLSNKVGAAFIRQARAHQEFIEDPLLLNYLNTLGNKLVKALPDNSQQFTFHLVNDPTLNAYAVPGGHVVIHTGLILRTKNEQQLAATLAHEIAHVTQNHTARGIENSRYDSAITIASILLAIAVGSGDGAQAAIMAGQGGIAQRNLGYSRSFESEADNEAIKTLSNAGFDPNAMTNFLHIMNAEQRFARNNPLKFLLTHPLTEDRIVRADLRARAYKSSPKKSHSQLDFMNFKSAIQVEFHDQSKQFIKTLKPNDENTFFKLGIALSKEGLYKKSQETLNKALALNSKNLMYQVSLAELLSKQNKFNEAINVYDSIKLNRQSDHQQVILYHANTLILAKENRQAIDLLEAHIEKSPENPLAHILLARAYGELNLLLESYSARAEYHYLRGNLNFAIKQLDNALRYTDNEFIKQDLENKKKRFRRELSETKASLKKL